MNRAQLSEYITDMEPNDVARYLSESDEFITAISRAVLYPSSKNQYEAVAKAVEMIQTGALNDEDQLLLALNATNDH